MRQEISLLSNTNKLSFQTIRKHFLFLIYCSEWDRFAKAEYERLAMEEENGEDSEMLDAMEGWDSDQDDANREGGPGAGGAAAA
jgi:hypothetical protein